MNIESETDRIKGVYRSCLDISSIQERWSDVNSGNVLILQERFNAVSRLFSMRGFLPINEKILEIGCRTRKYVKSVLELGYCQRLFHGIDLMEDRIHEAVSRAPGYDLECSNAENLE